MANKNLALLGHAPSDRTKRFIANQKGDWVTYQYLFHTDKLCDTEEAVMGVLQEIHQAVDLEYVGRILFAPPGLGPAVDLMSEGIRGISGVRPEILLLLRNGNGEYVPCMPRATLDSQSVYYRMRKLRSNGVLL